MRLNTLSVLTLCCVGLISQCSIGEAAAYAGPQYHKDYPGKCYFNADAILEGGETRQDTTSCGIYHCTGGERGYGSHESCGVISVPANCPIIIDAHAPYPLCCTNTLECDYTKETDKPRQVSDGTRVWNLMH